MSGAARHVFVGAEIFDGRTGHARSALVVEDGKVAAILPEAEGLTMAGQVHRLAGGVLAPGFIDLQVNGGGGVMLGDAASPEGIAGICATHAGLGTTVLLPTLISDTRDRTGAVVEAAIAATRSGVPGFLGLHLEGPHLDPRKAGAHDARLLRSMTDDDVAFLSRAAAHLPVLMVTLAPEAVTLAQISALDRAGVVVSLGHSSADIGTARAAFRAGASCVTHLFNAMAPMGHRAPGLVGAALDTGAVFTGIIADGFHITPEVLRIALAAKRPPGGIFVVTDAMAVAGTTLREFDLGGRRIHRRDGRLTLPDGTLAGADHDMAGALRQLVGPAGVPREMALAMATSVPAACIGASDKVGHLAPGAAADMVHLDEGLHLKQVWRAGLPI